jgi:hypothetical protein
MMKFSRAISEVRWFSFLETDVSKTISVLVLRVVALNWVRWRRRRRSLFITDLAGQPRLCLGFGPPFGTHDQMFDFVDFCWFCLLFLCVVSAEMMVYSFIYFLLLLLCFFFIYF